MTNNDWKQLLINDITTQYSISRYGDVRNDNTGRILIPFIRPKGYQVVCLSIGGKQYQRLVHRLVAMAFIPNPDNKPWINHKDGVTSFNTWHNLEWSNSSENTAHGQNILHKLGNKLLLIPSTGSETKEFPSFESVMKFLGVRKSAIRRAIRDNAELNGYFIQNLNPEFKCKIISHRAVPCIAYELNDPKNKILFPSKLAAAQYYRLPRIRVCGILSGNSGMRTACGGTISFRYPTTHELTA